MLGDSPHPNCKLTYLDLPHITLAAALIQTPFPGYIWTFQGPEEISE
jgi:hypothetical protein